MELYNEFSELILIYHLICFTDFVPNIDTRDVVGSSMVYSTGINLLVNLFVIFYSSLSNTLRKLKLKRLKYLQKKYIQKQNLNYQKMLK